MIMTIRGSSLRYAFLPLINHDAGASGTSSLGKSSLRDREPEYFIFTRTLQATPCTLPDTELLLAGKNLSFWDLPCLLPRLEPVVVERPIFGVLRIEHPVGRTVLSETGLSIDEVEAVLALRFEPTVPKANRQITVGNLKEADTLALTGFELKQHTRPSNQPCTEP